MLRTQTSSHTSTYKNRTTPKTIWLRPRSFRSQPLVTCHKTNNIFFCVDDFGIKSYSKEDSDHLINALKTIYNVTVDWEGQEYCGLHFDWDYYNGTVDISMPNFTNKTLVRLGHTTPTKPQHAPHRWNKPTYGIKQQLTPEEDTSDPLSSKEKNMDTKCSRQFSLLRKSC